jgi:hypothetical protein
MSTQIQRRRGTTAQHSTFTGANAELTVDTDKEVVVVHDGTTAGGYPLMRENASNSALALGSAGTPSLKFTGDTNTGIYSPGADQLAVATNGVGRLFVDASGNVGVGTSPGAQLDILSSGFSNLRVRSSAANSATINLTNSARNYSFNTNSGDFYIRDESAVAERLRITSAGNVGIGTSSPISPLDVNGQVRAGNLQITDGTYGLDITPRAYGVQLETRGTNQAIDIRSYGTTSASYITLATQNTERLRIDSSGRVGIGTTSPAVELEVSGPTNTQVLINCQSDTGNSQLWFGDSSSDEAGVIVYRHADNSMAFEVNDTEALRIDSSRRLLVGTSTARSNIFGITPYFQLEGANSNSNRFASLTYGQNDPAGGAFSFNKHRGSAVGGNTIVQNGDALGGINFTGADGTNFIVGASVKAEVDGTPSANDMPGRLVFSVTADGAASPTERMRIDSTGAHQMLSDSTILSLRRSAGTSTTGAFFDGRHDASMTTDGTRTIVIRVDGDVENANNSYGALSDFKLKENIVDASSQWSDLKDLRIRNYNFKPETGYGTHTQLGLIAQEVELVSPGLVSESPDCDEDGNDLGTVTKSVNYSVLYMKAVKALQEAMERIETLEAKVAALESA